MSVRSITSGPYAAVTGNIRTMEGQAGDTGHVHRGRRRRHLTGGAHRHPRPLLHLGSVAAYWVRPGMTARVPCPWGTPELHLVAAVEFDLAAGTMTTTTRLPDGTYTIGA